jgi:hypothetical protein
MWQYQSASLQKGALLAIVLQLSRTGRRIGDRFEAICQRLTLLSTNDETVGCQICSHPLLGTQTLE